MGVVLSLGELSDQNLTKASYFTEEKKNPLKKTKTKTKSPRACSLPGSLQFVCTEQHASRTPVWDFVPNLQIK